MRVCVRTRACVSVRLTSRTEAFLNHLLAWNKVISKEFDDGFWLTSLHTVFVVFADTNDSFCLDFVTPDDKYRNIGIKKKLGYQLDALACVLVNLSISKSAHLGISRITHPMRDPSFEEKTGLKTRLRQSSIQWHNQPIDKIGQYALFSAYLHFQYEL